MYLYLLQEEYHELTFVASSVKSFIYALYQGMWLLLKNIVGLKKQTILAKR